MDHTAVEIDEKQLQILATQLGILYPNYDPDHEQETYPTTDPGPHWSDQKKSFAEVV